MKVMIDTNVIMDVFCNRKGFVDDSLAVFKWCEVNELEGFLSALSVPNIIYIMRKDLNNEKIATMLASLSAIFKIVDLREADLFRAIQLNFPDYEDAIQTVCAQRVKAKFIVTRDKKGFSSSPVPAVTPSELLKCTGLGFLESSQRL